MALTLLRPKGDDSLGGQVPLPSETTSASVARRVVRDSLREFPPALVETAELLAAELVGNAVKHARPPLSLRLARLPDGGIRLEVRDRSPELPLPRHTSPDDVDGYGLTIVKGLAAEWGVDVAPGHGKTVWCLLSPSDPPFDE